MSIKAKSLISALLLMAFIGAGIFSFTHALDMAKGSHHVGGCPLIEGQEVLCQLSPLGHLALWQKATTIKLETFAYLLVISALIIVSYLFRFLSDNHSPPKKSLLRTFRAQLPIDLYTRIFADGILNPKAP